MQRIINRQTPQSRQATRRGAVLILVMVCLLIVTMLLASLLKSALMQRRQVIREQLRVQAEWLAESALERAVEQRLKNPNYKGEVWEIRPEDLGTRYAASAVIQLKPAEKTDRLSIEARIRYPEDETFSVTRTRKIIL
ncbi:hypothetical protein FYZ48_17965 [Gimesia chilikensis]|uniref:hypothetical protein n=1 Tax=Gimesia chilikensis TaxID=2605989 RepID=UPI0011EE7D16|nr:hypothetical protein [Gimesia chilikensis]KAA0136014.1 hypothetical protein FYZ48_17965 [Gimesia chilikensis]